MKIKRKPKSIPFEKLKADLMKDSGFSREYEKLQPEFELASAIIGARIKRKISQEELAKIVGTGQAVISRLEGMNAKPSLSLIHRLADALGLKFELKFTPR